MTVFDDDKLAEIIFDALKEAGSGVVSGVARESGYFNGELIDGVVIDGLFDLKKAAEIIRNEMEKLKK